MARKVVVLNYGPEGLTPDPEPVQLSPEDTVFFTLGTGPSDGHIKVTWETPDYFSRVDFDSSAQPEDITVTAALEGPVHYDCRLFVGGAEQAQPANAAGGTGVPVKGGSGKGK